MELNEILNHQESNMIEKVDFNFKSVYGDPQMRTGHFGVHYREIPCVKCPFDYVLYQMLIMSVKPDLIIEIGTDFTIDRTYCDFFGINATFNPNGFLKRTNRSSLISF